MSSRTPLFLAVAQRNVDVAHILLGHHAVEVNSVDSAGQTPLEMALLHTEDLDMATALIEHGAQLDLVDAEGRP